jgi:ABC-type antimicrobial peptide transport system permease subunit
LGHAIATAPDAAGRAAKASLERHFARDLSVLTVPVNLVNFGQAVNFPAFLGVTLALFGAATLAHLLLVSVLRRRREIALLKVLGFVRLQVGTAVCWQATTVAVVGIVVGVPTGLAVGTAVWNPFALNLGAVPVAVVPAAIIALLAGCVVAFANLLAIVPAAIASRRHPAEALREA